VSTLPNLKILPFGGAGAVQDPDQLAKIKNINVDLLDVINDDAITEKFLEKYRVWVQSTQSNHVQGLDQFAYSCYTNATTEAFDKFYLKNHTRRFRCFRGEYMYHILSWRNCFPNWCYMDQDDLKSGDAVVISFPFADTGGKHNDMDQVLALCEAMDIPVLLDCAYMGICSGLDIDLTWSCITDVTFSMSKSFPLSHARIGMRVTRRDDDDPLFVLNKTNYTNRIGAYIGYELLQEFGPDYIPTRYREQQHQWCKELGAEPSATVIFGLGNQRWKDYDRGAGNYRLCFYKYLALKLLPDGY